MKNPAPPVSNELPEWFADRLMSSESHLLMLDYDGTLAPFKVERNAAVPYTGVRERLTGILEAGGEVVVISGRPATEVAALLALDKIPAIWGCHGYDLMHTDGRVEKFSLPQGDAEELRKVWTNLKSEGLESHIELKHGSVALHWRGEPDESARKIESIGNKLMKPAKGKDLALRPFDNGLELRTNGRNKGTVVRELLTGREEGLAVAYLGDDNTDEDAFRSLKGIGLGILVRSEWRPTESDAWLKPPEDLIEFLGRWETSCRGSL